MIDPALLRALPLFARVNDRALAALAARATERAYEPGEVMFSAGSVPHALIIVASGRVRVVRGRDGRQHVVHEEGPGGALGEVPVFAGGSYPATAIAAEATHGIHVPAGALVAATREDPEVALVFLRRLAERTRLLVDRIDRLAAQGVRGRLAWVLAERQRAAGPGVPFPLGQTQAELAEELGTVREVLVRELRQLREAGLIEPAGRGRWVVRNLEALEALGR